MKLTKNEKSVVVIIVGTILIISSFLINDELMSAKLFGLGAGALITIQLIREL